MGAIIKPLAGSVESRGRYSRRTHVLRIRAASTVRASAYIHSHSAKLSDCRRKRKLVRERRVRIAATH
jgi:hypothetical protein